MAEKDDKDVHSHDSDVYSDLEQNSIRTLALLKTIIQWSELRLLQAKWVTYKAKWAKLVSKKEKQNRWEKKQIMSRPNREPIYIFMHNSFVEEHIIESQSACMHCAPIAGFVFYSPAVHS